MSQELPIIRPSHIDTSKCLFDAFGHSETEEAANWVVRFCKDRDDSWDPFTLDEIIAWRVKLGGPERFSFHRLVGSGITRAEIEMLDEEGNQVGWDQHQDPGVKFHISDSFIRRCFKANGAFHRPEEAWQ